jgi:hypothetical protein
VLLSKGRAIFSEPSAGTVSPPGFQLAHCAAIRPLKTLISETSASRIR